MTNRVFEEVIDQMLECIPAEEAGLREVIIMSRDSAVWDAPEVKWGKHSPRIMAAMFDRFDGLSNIPEWAHRMLNTWMNNDNAWDMIRDRAGEEQL